MKSLILCLAILALSSCHNNELVIPYLPITPAPPDIPVQQLLAAPDTILAGGRQLYLSTYMWRDFMPISPPDGKPLIALIFVAATDSMQPPPGIVVDAVWIVNNNQVWKSLLLDPFFSATQPRLTRIEKVARDGPKWGPNVFVDVIVHVGDGTRQSFLLHASHQWISMTN